MSVNNQFASIQANGTFIRTTSTLTGSYVTTSTVDMTSYDSVIVHIIVGTAQASTTANCKFQWSIDGSHFADETVDTPTASAAGTPGEQPYTPYVRRIDIPMDTAGYVYTCRLRRLGSSFQMAAKSSGVTSGTLSIKICKASNFN